jgi:hypothetical protein
LLLRFYFLFFLSTRYATANKHAIANTASKHGVGVGLGVGEGVGVTSGGVGIDIGATSGVGAGTTSANSANTVKWLNFVVAVCVVILTVVSISVHVPFSSILITRSDLVAPSGIFAGS